MGGEGERRRGGGPTCFSTFEFLPESWHKNPCYVVPTKHLAHCTSRDEQDKKPQFANQREQNILISEKEDDKQNE